MSRIDCRELPSANGCDLAMSGVAKASGGQSAPIPLPALRELLPLTRGAQLPGGLVSLLIAAGHFPLDLIQRRL